MSNLLESYRVLGVKVGADLAAVTTSYKQLCREYHPDISDNPNAEEMMKQVNVAYTVLRDNFKREAAFRDRMSFATRPVRRYTTTPVKEQPKTRQTPTDPARYASEQYRRKAAQQAAEGFDAETDSRKVLHDYFNALNSFDYAKAYEYLSQHDKNNITLESFIQWREAVTRLYPMREFKIAPRSSVAVVTWGGSRIFHARKFKVIVTEDDYTASRAQSGEHDKLVIIENDTWRVFLGYKEVSELTRTFEKRFEKKQKQEIDKRYEEFAAGLDTQYDMFNMTGMRKAVAKEVYRQQRYGSAITFAVISVKMKKDNETKQNEMLRSAAKTLNSQLRELDICAYAGDGIFAVLFVELGRRNALNIIGRVIEMIKKNVQAGIGESIEIVYHFDCWSENRYVDFEQINDLLKLFDKKI